MKLGASFPLRIETYDNASFGGLLGNARYVTCKAYNSYAVSIIEKSMNYSVNEFDRLFDFT